jgi:glycosyltransferase involved in cell wall biosynthesis
MKISVLIPVYNAVSYIKQAVDSAISQPETSEIILVEDGSTENDWDVCQQLTHLHTNIKLYRHPDGKNHGAAVTRNLAFQKSTCDFIAFLDADDYYLPGRFSVAKELLKGDPNLDGVYEPIAIYLEDEAGTQRWHAAGKPTPDLYMTTRRVSPEDLFEALVMGGSGNFHLNGLVIKRSVYEKAGMQDENLIIHQDAAFMIKAAAVAKLTPGRMDQPVAMRRVHAQNRISAPRSKSSIYKLRIKYRHSLWVWGRNHLNQTQQNLLFLALIKEGMTRTRFNIPISPYFNKVQARIQLGILPLIYPELVLHKKFWKAFLPGDKH